MLNCGSTSRVHCVKVCFQHIMHKPCKGGRSSMSQVRGSIVDEQKVRRFASFNVISMQTKYAGRSMRHIFATDSGSVCGSMR